VSKEIISTTKSRKKGLSFKEVESMGLLEFGGFGITGIYTMGWVSEDYGPKFSNPMSSKPN